MISGIQILGILFGLFMAYSCFLHYKRKELIKLEFYLWETLWLVFIIIVIFPNIVNVITKYLGVIRAMDLFTIVAFMFLTSLIFYIYIGNNKLKKKIEELTRKEAIRNHK